MLVRQIQRLFNTTFLVRVLSHVSQFLGFQNVHKSNKIDLQIKFTTHNSDNKENSTNFHKHY